MYEIWIAPNTIRQYTRDELYFLLKNYDYLVEGKYPPDPSTYVSSGGGNRSPGAPHELALTFKAEIDRRLKICNGDGKLLLSECRRGCRIIDLPWECMTALNYISWSPRSLLHEVKLPSGGIEIGKNF